MVAPIRLRRGVEIGHRDLETDDIAGLKVRSYTALLFGGDDIIIGGDVDFEHHPRRPTAHRSAAALAQRRLVEPGGLPRIAQHPPVGRIEDGVPLLGLAVPYTRLLFDGKRILIIEIILPARVVAVNHKLDRIVLPHRRGGAAAVFVNIDIVGALGGQVEPVARLIPAQPDSIGHIGRIIRGPSPASSYNRSPGANGVGALLVGHNQDDMGAIRLIHANTPWFIVYAKPNIRIIQPSTNHLIRKSGTFLSLLAIKKPAR